MGKKSAEVASPSMPDEWESREDVDRLLRADEVHQDPKRAKRAIGRLTGVVNRLAKKHGRSKGRSASR